MSTMRSMRYCMYKVHLTEVMGSEVMGSEESAGVSLVNHLLIEVGESPLELLSEFLESVLCWHSDGFSR